MLKVENAFLRYGVITALRGINLQVRPGQIVSLIGANGSGKTSLIRAITAVHPLSEGQITIAGRQVNSAHARTPSHLLVRARVALVPEGRRVFSNLTVRENLALGAYSLPAGRLRQQLEQAFQMFPLLRERAGQQAGYLSGGEQQMLAIARALMSSPQLLLLDEPSLGLAPLIVRELMELIGRINREQGVTVLLVEQNARQALALSQYSYILAGGLVQKSGTGVELLHDPAVVEAYLGAG